MKFDADIGGGASPFTFEWDFNGDGIIDSVSKSPIGEFRNKGRFNVLLKVTDADGDITTSTVTISVKEKLESRTRKIVHINSIGFDKEYISPGDDLYIFLNFENNGNFNLKDVRLTAIIQELGIRSRTVKANANDGQQASKVLTLEIPEYAEPGRYWVEIVIDIDGNRRIKYRPIDII